MAARFFACIVKFYLRHAAVEGDEQVEALLLPNLTDDDPRRSHSQGLLDEPAQRHLARAFEARLPTLHGGDVALRDLQPELQYLH